MTVEELTNAGLPITADEINCLFVDSALDWIIDNTTLDFDKNNVEEIKALPSSVKLFILKYKEIMSTDSMVTSESIEGLSQSFNSTDKNVLLYQLAQQLLGKYLKSALSFVQSEKRWR